MIALMSFRFSHFITDLWGKVTSVSFAVNYFKCTSVIKKKNKKRIQKEYKKNTKRIQKEYKKNTKRIQKE